jgi:hypothetical protein
MEYIIEFLFINYEFKLIFFFKNKKYINFEVNHYYFKSLMKLFFGFISLLVFLNSCSIEKRLHNKGYFINWNNKKLMNSTKIDKTHINNQLNDITSINNERSEVQFEEGETIETYSKSDVIEDNQTNYFQKNPVVNQIHDKLQKVEKNIIQKTSKKKSYKNDNIILENNTLDSLILVGLILGILSFLLSFISIGFLIGIVSLIITVIRMTRLKLKNELSKKSKIVAIIAIILNVLSILISAYLIWLWMQIVNSLNF